jgi:hypothetical protein
MMLPFLKNNTKIYIVAPANSATGGPELLHQLAYQLKSIGWNVMMYYVPDDRPDPVHKNYVEYDTSYSRSVEDVPENVMIIPETSTYLLDRYQKIKKMVWWLSVDNYFIRIRGVKGRINRFLFDRLGSQNYFFFEPSLRQVDYHVVQSYYAETVLKKHHIANYSHLSDYLNERFMTQAIDLAGKKNIVAYNPKKGKTFTRKIIDAAKGIQFIPISGMSREEVVSVLTLAKVYIDFGHHPGKDRIPREAAMLGCCVITNRRGSARYVEDVPIPEEFKFDESKRSIPLISEKIQECFTNYTHCSSTFDAYRTIIRNQEAVLTEQIHALFRMDPAPGKADGR